MTAEARQSSGEGDAYGGALTAPLYALRATESWLFRSYVVVGGLFALVVTALFVLSLVALIGQTAGVGGGSFSFSRAFFVVVAVTVVAPLVAPLLFVARRHRLGRPDRRFDAVQALLGYLFVPSLYVAAVVFAPPALQSDPSGSAAGLLALLNAVPDAAGFVPPLAVAATQVAVTRYWSAFRFRGDART